MWEQLKRRSSYQALPTIEPKKQNDLFRDLHHPVFQSIRIIQVSINLCIIIFCHSNNIKHRWTHIDIKIPTSMRPKQSSQ